MKIIKGDLLQLAVDGHFDAIVHGCNCFNAMGKGIALTIKNRFPEAYAADCRTEKGDYGKLGHYSFANIPRGDGSEFTIFNAYTQFTYWDRSVPVLFEYEAFQEVLECFNGIDYSLPAVGESRLRWGFPLIGCGLAGGDKERILRMIEDTMRDCDVTVVEFQPKD